MPGTAVGTEDKTKTQSLLMFYDIQSCFLLTVYSHARLCSIAHFK